MTDTLGTSNLKEFPEFDGRTDYRSWAKRAGAVVLEGWDEPEDMAAKTTLKRVNDDICSILFLSTSGTTATVMEPHHPEERKGLGNGQAAWRALATKYTTYTRDGVHAMRGLLIPI